MPVLGTRGPATGEPTPAPFFALSLDHFQGVNPAFLRTFGYTEAELLDQPFIAFVHPDDRGATLAELEKLSSGRPTHGFEHRFRCRDGAFRWLSWTAVATPEAARHASERAPLRAG